MSGNAGAMEDVIATAGAEREPYLRIEHITKMFGTFTALEDVSLEVHEGEFICFLGPSGCGKTTLLRCIAGLDIQTYGRVVQAGQDISTLPPSARDFGIVFQSYALFPNLTVFKNLAYGLENRRMRRTAIEQRVAELLDLVGLADQRDKYPSQLSGGQQQRVALTRALATSPGLLLLDEPLSALDAKVRVHLRHEVRRLQRQLGVTTIMVTHDQEEALTMADRIVVMDQGVIVQAGNPIDIYRRPATAFVANFVGTMNFIPAAVLGQQRVRIGAVELGCAEALGGLAEGAAVTVCVRPEDLAVRDIGHGARNAAPARVDDMEFLGAFYRATLVVDGLDGLKLIADLPPNVVRSGDIHEGSDLSLVFPDDRICVFGEPQNAVS